LLGIAMIVSRWPPLAKAEYGLALAVLVGERAAGTAVPFLARHTSWRRARASRR
jgi:hypothetical protein